jgi:polyisoprenoid-binding protein YceI
MKNYMLTLGIILLSGLLVWGEANFTLVESVIKIEGTSNVHDWVSTSKSAKVTGSVTVEAGVIKAIRNLKVTIPVKGIKSTKGSIMDDKTWNALKSKKHPNIYYTLKSVTSIAKSKSGTAYIIKTNGNLTIAGVTKNINMAVVGKVLTGNQVKFIGSHKLKMTDFGIDPPTALLGTMTTGNDIKIKYNITVIEPPIQ